jgi:hypothetical protein
MLITVPPAQSPTQHIPGRIKSQMFVVNTTKIKGGKTGKTVDGRFSCVIIGIVEKVNTTFC